jgi:hypothetical protein
MHDCHMLEFILPAKPIRHASSDRNLDIQALASQVSRESVLPGINSIWSASQYHNRNPLSQCKAQVMLAAYSLGVPIGWDKGLPLLIRHRHFPPEASYLVPIHQLLSSTLSYTLSNPSSLLSFITPHSSLPNH